MTNLEKAYFDTFTLDRLKAFRKAVSKQLKYDVRGEGFIVKVWKRKGGKQIFIRVNRRKIDAAIKLKESCNTNNHANNCN